jgi:YidC/Oxa1 family membrane protein insertase
MGATFYRVPAGLCLYFIATNVWSMTERYIFEKKAKAAALNPSPVAVPASPANAEPPKPSRWMEWLKKLQEAADKEVSIRREGNNGSEKRDNGADSKGGKKRSKR